MFKFLLLILFIVSLIGCTDEKQEVKNGSSQPMISQQVDRRNFTNPYANIPAQCYIETSNGTQNACLFCHSNAPARTSLGNTTPQAGLSDLLGNLQLEYSFSSIDKFAPNPNINPWENTLQPQKLQEAFELLKIDERKWDMNQYLNENNWAKAYAKKQGSPLKSNSDKLDDPFRLFPALNPTSLPAKQDGFVRTKNPKESLFRDEFGLNTGWRAINFVPYGIFTPHSGSVSGVYIRLPLIFMQDENKNFDIEIYKENLHFLELAITDNLQNQDLLFKGMAKEIKVQKGLYPIGTEFAHPLHYVDVERNSTRALRVKEIRYSYKYKMFYPQELSQKAEDAPLYLNEKEHWIDNGAGWYLSGFIEDKEGELRGQTSEELLQCVGCHSSRYGFEPQHFTSGTGNTIDTIWSFSRKYPLDLGWAEMDYLAHYYDFETQTSHSKRGDALNRDTQMGEMRYFLNHVVGASLYGDMPSSMEQFLTQTITKKRGYSDDFLALKFNSPQELNHIQNSRLNLMREFSEKKEHLTTDGYIQPSLLYPTKTEALEMAKNYRKVVATQRFTKGKDYFGKTLFTFKYYRDEANKFTHINGKNYHFGETITDRTYTNDNSILQGVGNTSTLIYEKGDNYDREYMPILKSPLAFE